MMRGSLRVQFIYVRTEKYLYLLQYNHLSCSIMGDRYTEPLFDLDIPLEQDSNCMVNSRKFSSNYSTVTNI